MSCWRNVSQLTCATCTKLRKRLLRETIQLSCLGVLLDLLVEAGSIEFLEPSAKSRKLVGW
jgi:hypothetical protein